MQGRLVSAEFLSTLGVKPLVGRDFLPEEDRAGATPAVILSYGFWQRRFGNDPGIIGRQLTLNDQSYAVVGITPPDFQYGAEADVTVPFGLALTRTMKTLLFGVSATDPLTFAGIAMLLTFFALLACFVPAKRATTIDPLTTLRQE